MYCRISCSQKDMICLLSVGNKYSRKIYFRRIFNSFLREGKMKFLQYNRQFVTEDMFSNIIGIMIISTIDLFTFTKFYPNELIKLPMLCYLCENNKICDTTWRCSWVLNYMNGPISYGRQQYPSAESRCHAVQVCVG